MKKIFLNFFLIAILLVTGLFSHNPFQDENIIKFKKLNTLAKDYPHWKYLSSIPMDEKIKNALNLDDYIFEKFSDGESIITLYIGYYYNAKKVGAAHDPMVCFPGQGWKVLKTSKKSYKINKNDHYDIKYSTITASLGEQYEHILYWFQAHNKTAQNTLLQKIFLFKSTIRREGQENAFVRFSTPCAQHNTEYCEQKILSFVQEFYPGFLKFTTTN
ncbi:EpsI family protein [Desulfobulbus rhabdoformis]|uniref:exosortase C-terminal domain/associated protein EpsI n=1 Tax=Desulfobulbus rhabdoformis TaxID=34032 RepID=UPI0019669BBD|nr:exosortase C-terminal domain/associated protein EpsI [Desulfobulbus rhabdoformis]MBM9616721.1 EpsI family protein [Desulfobulbus rhabdoformis]